MTITNIQFQQTMVKYSGGDTLKDNLEILYLKCPHCGETSHINHWGTMDQTTTDTSMCLSFVVPNLTEKSYLVCLKCGKNSSYAELVEAMRKEANIEI